VYRKELRPVITRGARAINELFDVDGERWATLWPTPQAIPAPHARARWQNVWLTRAFLVGDTGFEPVTSSVSVISVPRWTAPLSAATVRGCTGPDAVDRID
ncbi:MAG TPA: hypothetical protein VI036_11205, partial [Propionibacteriaceae bacterium]